MTHSFSALVSDALQDIAHALRHPQPAEPSKLLGTDLIDHSRDAGVHPASIEAILPSHNVDRLTGGSHVLEDEASEAEGYVIFARHAAQTPFRYRAVLDTTLERSRFVDNAYMAILERPADEAGRGNYVMMLREGYLRPVELIKALAASDEFLQRPTRIVVVPQTSQWLSRLAAKVETLEIRTAMDL